MTCHEIGQFCQRSLRCRGAGTVGLPALRPGRKSCKCTDEHDGEVRRASAERRMTRGRLLASASKRRVERKYGVRKICVYGCPGRGGEAEPHVFYLGARRLPVVAILDRWHDAAHRYFEVKAEDGRCFLLRHTPAPDHWELAGVSRTHRSLRPRVAALPAGT